MLQASSFPTFFMRLLSLKLFIIEPIIPKWAPGHGGPALEQSTLGLSSKTAL